MEVECGVDGAGGRRETEYSVSLRSNFFFFECHELLMLLTVAHMALCTCRATRAMGDSLGLATRLEVLFLETQQTSFK